VSDTSFSDRAGIGSNFRNIETSQQSMVFLGLSQDGEILGERASCKYPIVPVKKLQKIRIWWNTDNPPFTAK
jgi:hypothetical protein